MQYRPYGNNGTDLSIVAFAGIVVKDETAEDSSRYVSWAIDQGINYFDVAPGYGNAQNMLGPALEQYRNDVFLACKTKFRTGPEARADLENSLKLLRTDHFDLYQMHAMTTQEDLEVASGPGGALETIVKARDEGLVKHVGFSVHSVEVAVELMSRFDFDSVLFPVNFTTWFEARFGQGIMDEAEQRGVARLALKGAAHHALEDRNHQIREKTWYAPIEDRGLMKLALRWTLSQPITAAIPPGDPELWQMAVEVAQDFTPITPEEEQILRENAKGRTPLFELAQT
ncbi:aldo/keto reductase [Candidatus Lucifugimonas marina]|jgi:predicted aldo/keto reductase-like oxidoreductase|uniref:Aldo/keto reductase n=1 Tax=Candidatus Lucifugimonas marina TaxID=3038979 RepID=A0AAJ5ZD02_9CHLR|nr:aldo/keto reductase [SAR202 cluster bacterium JH702]MDG0868391.1 aldo/keto reductase [SAR202 cluster bacterium JH639]WFG35026.1 aldo/keto reductase [SAR202 cluster bacterium JH545]WFG38983.1 aldo/keto reductase [SAR202 cluster bacterium JH1073]